MLEAIEYSRGTLRLLEQRALPHEIEWIDIRDADDGWKAIRDMTVRGAPAIAIAGMLSLAVELVTGGEGMQFDTAENARSVIDSRLSYLETSRPTAVNLFIAVRQLKEVAEKECCKPGASGTSVVMAVVMAAEDMLNEDVRSNKVMGGYGADALLEAAKARGRCRAGGKIRVLTHCNTGSLATAAYGTALGVIRALHEGGYLEHVYCTETRPYNQGARLTAFEIATDNMPGTLICDSAVAALMQSNKVDAVVVGADRIAANGDTANKIGTFNIAVAAAYHNIPFFVAAPTTTIDVDLSNGSLIPIEQRSSEEITHFKGQRVAADLPVWNPSFDVTPATLIEGIITEKGMAPRASVQSSFSLRKWMVDSEAFEREKPRILSDESVELLSQVEIQSFEELTPSKAIEYVVSRPHLCIHVGDADTKEHWFVEEVGDGNLNYVFIVRGPQGAVCIKQAPPFVRVIGADWPLSQERSRVEADALVEQGRYCAAHVPAVLHFDDDGKILVMQYIAPPHLTLRKGLIAGSVYPLLSEHMVTFLSRTLFKTSYISMDLKEFRTMSSKFANEELCALTEQVIFSDPYFPARNNKHTSPQLDSIVSEIQSSDDIKAKVTKMKARFVEKQQALLHGDLHTGSVMASMDSTFVIDPEFAFVGPIGFDVGKFLANLLMTYFASDALSKQDGKDRSEQKTWLLSTIEEIWDGFKSKFLEQWNEKDDENRGLCWKEVFSSAEGATLQLQTEFFEELWEDILGYMACVIVRRIIGVAHVEDFQCIENADDRSRCEARALKLALRLFKDGSEVFKDIQALTQECK